MKTINFLFLLTITEATDVKVYVYNGYEYYGSHRIRPVPRDIFEFGYHCGNLLSMQIYLSIADPNVSADLYLQYPSDLAHIQKKVLPKVSSKGKQYFEIRRILNESEIVGDLKISTTTGHSTRKKIINGINVTGLPDEANNTLYNDICLKEQWCVIEVDLLNNVNKESTAPKQSFPNNVSYIMTSSVIVMSVIIISVICLIVKKYYHRDPCLVETMELNTYATANEVLYADLSLPQGDRQPPRRDEESPYAEIIRVVECKQ